MHISEKTQGVFPSQSTAFPIHQNEAEKRKENNKTNATYEKRGKRKVQGVPQSQTAALPRHQEEDKTDKSKQAQIEQTYEKH